MKDLANIKINTMNTSHQCMFYS